MIPTTVGEGLAGRRGFYQLPSHARVQPSRYRLPSGADGPWGQPTILHVAEVGEHMKRGDIPEGLTFGVKVLKEQPDFLGVELDRRLGTAFDLVVAEVIVEDFR